MDEQADPAKRFEQMFADHRDAVFGFAARRVGVDLADEVVSGTFLAAWRRMDTVPRDGERWWLLAAARLVLQNEQRSGIRRDRLARRLQSVPDGDEAMDVGFSESDAVMVRRALASIRAPDQEVLRLTAWDNLSVDDAAQVLGCTPAAYRVRLHRARRRLAAALSTEDQVSQQSPTIEQGQESTR